MNEPLNSFECIVRTLSPVHIGSGEKYLNHLDYLINGQKIQIFDKRKLFNFVEKNCNEYEVLEFTKSIANRYLSGWLKEKQIDLKEIILKSYNIASANMPREIQVHVKDGAGVPVIPGSSLKGALRTAILRDLKQKYCNEALQNTLDRIERESNFRDRELKFLDQTIAKKALGKDPNHNIMRLLSVGDFTFEESSLALLEAVIKSLSTTGTLAEKTFKIYPEVLMPGQQGRGIITFDKFLSWEDSKYNGEIFHFKAELSLEYLIHVVNNTSLNIIRKEITFFEERNPTVAKFYNKLQSELDSLAEDELITRIGWGSGWNSITGELLSSKHLTDDLRRKLKLAPHRLEFDFPKTRKLARVGSELQPLGWVKLKFKDREQVRKEKRERREREIEEARKLEEKRKAEEERKSYLASLCPEERDIEIVKDPTVSEQKVVEIFNKIDSFAETNKKKLAEALKNYWINHNKWKGKLSEKQKKKVARIKEILEKG